MKSGDHKRHHGGRDLDGESTSKDISRASFCFLGLVLIFLGTFWIIQVFFSRFRFCLLIYGAGIGFSIPDDASERRSERLCGTNQQVLQCHFWTELCKGQTPVKTFT